VLQECGVVERELMQPLEENRLVTPAATLTLPPQPARLGLQVIGQPPSFVLMGVIDEPRARLS
jgi:hypothetical protein